MAHNIEVKLIGDASSLNKALGQAAKTTESTFGKVSKAAGIAGLALAGGLAVGAKIGFDELEQGQKTAAQTNAVLKSTGDVANVTAGHVSDLAGALLQKSGVDDDVIQSGENMLLTFKNIRNEAGKGNDVFDQTTKATLDMSVAMGQDMSKSAILVGKALNDPVKGLTALQRVGVTFTDQQKKQIAAMVKSGDTMGAQKIILKELNSEFGGSAAAMGKTLPGQINILKESFSNLAGQLVGALLPAFMLVTGEALKVTKWMQDHQRATKFLVVGLAALSAILMGVGVAQKVYAAGAAIVHGITAVWTAAQWALNTAFLGFPVLWLVAGLVALGVGLVIAYKKSETFRKIVQGAFHGVQVVAGAVISFVTSHWRALFPVVAGIVAVIKLVKDHFDSIKGVVARVVGFVHDQWQQFKANLRTVVGVARTVSDALVKAFNTIKQPIQWLVNQVQWLIDHIPDIPSVPDWANPFSGGGGGGHPTRAQLTNPGAPRSVMPTVARIGAGRAVQVNLHLDGRQIASVLVDRDRDYARHNGGRGLFA